MKIVIENGGFMPKYAHPSDAGMDLRTPELIVVPANGSCIVDLRIRMQIPDSCFGKIESKSGLMCKAGIVAPGGVIDPGYTGSIKVKLENHSNERAVFERGDKIAQLIIIPCLHAQLQLAPELDDTERGENGFGSTGR